jgi:2-dehydropantoate 2-reductase
MAVANCHFGSRGKIMKIVIVGAGAIGRFFGAILGRGGYEVVFLEKDPHVVQAINEKGIHLKKLMVTDPSTTSAVTARATTDGGSVDTCDLIILAVKGYATAVATRSVAHLVNSEAPLLTIQTGLGNIETMAEIVDHTNILGGVTFHGATALQGSEVLHAGVGPTLIGELDGRRTERVKQVKKAFEVSGLQTTVSTNIVGHIWAKGLVYSAINPLTAVLRLKNGQLVEKMESIALAKRLIDEGKLVAQAYAVQLPRQDLYDRLLEVCGKTAENLSPMLQDILNNRATEIDALNGAIYTMGKHKSVLAPLHQAMTDMIRLLEKWGSAGELET